MEWCGVVLWYGVVRSGVYTAAQRRWGLHWGQVCHLYAMLQRPVAGGGENGVHSIGGDEQESVGMCRVCDDVEGCADMWRGVRRCGGVCGDVEECMGM